MESRVVSQRGAASECTPLQVCSGLLDRECSVPCAAGATAHPIAWPGARRAQGARASRGGAHGPAEES
eukprot:6184720-Prymnesium_polylepis.1